MNATTGSWITIHGLKRPGMRQLDLRGWFERLKPRSMAERKKDKEIARILSTPYVSSRLTPVETAQDYPIAWGHKKEARAGDTVYLRHKDNIRAVLLATAWEADPTNGKISVISPIGLALIGRHQGDKVRLNTLDGNLEYRILKIV